MATIVDKTACELAAAGAEDGLLPVNPFNALQFHFGMLLGVDDLETGQAYPRGKIRLHNAWLHREGVVWGLNVSFNSRNELAVDPGLALDAAGHELHLDRQACLDVGQWYCGAQRRSGVHFYRQRRRQEVQRARGCEIQGVPDEARAGDGRAVRGRADRYRVLASVRDRRAAAAARPLTAQGPRLSPSAGTVPELNPTAHRMRTSKRAETRFRLFRLRSSPPRICRRCGSSRRSTRST